MRHTCSQCGKQSVWTKTWSWWGSLAMVDDGLPVLKFCSGECVKDAGTKPAKKLLTIWLEHGASAKDFKKHKLLRSAA